MELNKKDEWILHLLSELGGFDPSDIECDDFDAMINDDQFSSFSIVGCATKAAELISRLSKPNWISVDDELPQEDFAVIACCDDDVHECIFRIYSNGDYYFESLTPCDMSTATHWMPLPKPPEGI